MHHSDLQPDLDRLRALERTGLLSSPPPAEFQEICRAARSRFGVAMAMVALVGEDRVVVTARAGTAPGAAPRLSGLCGRALRDDEVLVVPDAAGEPGLATSPMRQPALRFFAGAPLHYVRHIRLGALCLLDPQPRDFTPEDRAELERMAETVAGAIMDREFDRIAAAIAH